jgi:hypothetical protein
MINRRDFEVGETDDLTVGFLEVVGDEEDLYEGEGV